MYKDARPYSACQKVAWQDTKDYTALQENGLTKAATYIHVKGWTNDPSSSVRLGYITLSWYFVFRAQKANV